VEAGDLLVPETHVRLVPIPDAPLVETAVCWRAHDDRDDVAHLVATVADTLPGHGGSNGPPPAGHHIC
jgi:hypothetical protein